MTMQTTSSGCEPVLAEIIEELTDKLQGGDSVDIELYVRKYPRHEDALRGFMPTLNALVNLGRSSIASLSHHGAQEPISAAELGTLGDFRLIREVGRGGMGVVYEAVQISLNRRVALKVLPFAAALDNKQLQRFKNEAQAVACLHHQNIVSVYGVGCERAVHFYAMQFIDGSTLADLIRQRRQESGLEHGDGSDAGAVRKELVNHQAERPVPESTIRSAAALITKLSNGQSAYFQRMTQLGVQAAEALEHAHQFGVVHRDIKPANLLLDMRGNLWITDFGLAHCQSQVGLTMTGDVVGTLRYMSPEQALGTGVAIDPRVDVYALGGTLYELLTLQAPFNGRDRRELLRQICFEEPRPLRRLNPDIPGELETIVLKALEKNPADRYASAQELAEDLRRFLEDKPIRARKPSLPNRVKKFARRHQGVTVTGGIGAALVVLLMLLFLVYRNHLIAGQRDEADKFRRLAEERSKEARQAVDVMYTQFARKWLAQQPQMQSVQREFLEKALAFYEKLATESSTDPVVRFEKAQAYFRVAEIQHNLGDTERAERAYDQAILLLERLVHDFSDTLEYQRELAEAFDGLGILLGDTGRLPEAEQAQRRALALQEKLANEFPANSTYRRELARGLYHLGCTMAFSGQFAKVHKFLASAVRIQRKLAIELPLVPDIRAELADSLSRSGDEKSRREAAALLEKLVADSPLNPVYRNALAECYFFLSFGLPDTAAEAALRHAITIQEKLLADFPSTTNHRFDLARSQFELARMLHRKRRFDVAIEAYRLGLAVGEPLAAIPKVDYFRNRLAEAHDELGELLSASGQCFEAAKEYRHSIALYESLAAEYPKYRGQSLAPQRRLAAVLGNGSAAHKVSSANEADALSPKNPAPRIPPGNALRAKPPP